MKKKVLHSAHLLNFFACSLVQISDLTINILNYDKYIGNSLIGMLRICNTSAVLTIRHISALINYQRQKIGTLLLEKKQYKVCKIVAETDAESVNFYAKSGFTL
jgi:Acetyltransferase (GNAT) domain